MKNPYLFSGLAALMITTSSFSAPTPTPASQLVFPVLSTKAHVGSVWGDERDGGNRTHEGIDIFAAKGTSVVSVADGTVIEVSEDGIGGKTITIQSEDYSWRAYYAHLNEQKVRTGQIVKKGQLIGTVGNTGNAKGTTPHLHFGIYHPGGAVDPLPYVKNSPRISKPVDAGAPVYEERKVEPTIAKSSTKKRRRDVSPVIKSAAVGILTNIFTRKMRGGL